MNFKELSQHLVTDTCPLGSGFEVTVDANKFAGECFRRMARTYRTRASEFEETAPLVDRPAETVTEAALRYEQTQELSAITTDVEREVLADVLASDRYGIIHDWKLDDGTPPTFENMMQLNGSQLRFLFEWAREAGSPKEHGTPKKTRRSRTTSETISDGSSAPTTLSPASPTM